VVFLSSSREFLGSNIKLGHDRFLLHPFQFIIHLSVLHRSYIARVTIIFLNSVKKLMFIMVTACVLFEVRPEILNIIFTGFGLKGLICTCGKINANRVDLKLLTHSPKRTAPNLRSHIRLRLERNIVLQLKYKHNNNSTQSNFIKLSPALSFTYLFA
jgi:hypothetical protein